MSKLFKGPSFKAPKQIAPLQPAVDATATAVDVISGGDGEKVSDLRKKYRPGGIGSTGTGLSL